MTAEPGGRLPRVAILADDLIWGTRLADAVRRAGGEAMPVRNPAALPGALVAADGCLVDLTARAYDGLAALAEAAAAGVPTVAVGQRAAADARRAARAAGASKVYAYRTQY